MDSYGHFDLSIEWNIVKLTYFDTLMFDLNRTQVKS